jgi:hypothetical protein
MPRQRCPARKFANSILQLAASLAVLSLAWPYYGIRNETLPWPQTALAIGAAAGLLASLSRQPWWWRVMHALFAPLAWSVSTLGIDPGWFLLLFIMLLLVYRGAAGGQVPLYFSNRPTAAALARITAELPDLRFIDLGAGIGSVLLPLARERPDAHFTGVENAPATWLLGRLRTAGLANCDWRWGDLWRSDFAAYNVVYAFLSPAPMAALWDKVEQEMPPGSLLISNSFAVPSIPPTYVIDVADARQTRLYCYRPATLATESSGSPHDAHRSMPTRLASRPVGRATSPETPEFCYHEPFHHHHRSTMMSNHDSLTDPLSFAKKMWGGMGFSLPGMVTPTLDVEEIEKKVKDLKAVESWLKMNLSMLQMTIQGLEMQCVTLNAVRAMGQMATSYGPATPGDAQGGSAAAGSGNEVLKQAALWPLTMLQQMQEQMQKAATAVTQASQTRDDEAKPKP